MSDPAERWAAIEAKEDIRELAAQYCHAAVDSDVKAIIDLFTDDAVLCIYEFPASDEARLRWSGRDELTAFYQQDISGGQVKPFIHNHVIELDHDGQNAHGRVSCTLLIEREGQPRRAPSGTSRHRFRGFRRFRAFQRVSPGPVSPRENFAVPHKPASGCLTISTCLQKLTRRERHACQAELSARRVRDTQADEDR